MLLKATKFGSLRDCRSRCRLKESFHTRGRCTDETLRCWTHCICLAPFGGNKALELFSGFQKWSGLRTGNVCFPGGARALAEGGGCGSHPVLDCRASPLESPPTLGRGKRSIQLAHCERTAQRHVGPAVVGQAG